MSSRIRVLQTIRQGLIGGGESHVLTLVRHLNPAVFEPIVLSFTEGPMVEELKALGIQTHVIHSNYAFSIPTWRQVRKLIRKEAIQLVHAHGTRALTNVYWAANQENLPLLYTVHGWSFHEALSPFVKQARIIAERYLTDHTNLTICVSQPDLDLGNTLFPDFRSRLIHYGIDMTRFNLSSRTDEVRRQYSLGPQQIVIGSVARLTIQKDPITLLQAFAQVAPRYPNAVLLLIGSGELKADVVQTIEQLNLGKQVILDDFRQDIPQVLQSIDIFCLPSLWEGMPIALIEALSMGKPVIATAVNGTAELIQDGVNGLLIPIRNPDRLAQAMARLLDDAALRQLLSVNALNSVITKFSAIKMTHNVEQAYKDVLNESGNVSNFPDSALVKLN